MFDHPGRGRRPLLAALALASLVVAACGDDGVDTGSTESDAAATADTGSTGCAAVQPEATAPDGTEPAATEPGAAGSTEPGGTAPDGTVSDTTPDAPSVDQAAIDAAAAAFLEQQAAQGVTAFYVAVSDPAAGDTVSVYGDAAVDGPAATADDNFRIGSITKTFTATVVLQLVEDGELSLDDTVGDLLPDLAAAHPELEPLTVRQLLSMQSGVSDYLNGVDTVVSVVVDDPTTVWEPEELVAAGVDAGVEAPGTLGYSTTNYIVLQLIAESITGTPLADLIADRVTGPLGLEGIFLPPNDDTTLPAPATHGYVDGGCIDELAADGASVEPGTDVTDWNASYGQGGGGMTSDIDGLLRWAASGTGNDTLADTTVAERLSFELLPEGVPYGLGILQIGPWLGHEGEAIGWEALALHDPDTGTSIAMAANGCGGLVGGFLDVLGSLDPDTMEGLST